MTAEVAQALANAGPWAVVIFIGGAIAIVGLKVIRVLWEKHLEADADDRAVRDQLLDSLPAIKEGLKLSAEAQRDMAAAWDARNRSDAARARRGDR